MSKKKKKKKGNASSQRAGAGRPAKDSGGKAAASKASPPKATVVELEGSDGPSGRSLLVYLLPPLLLVGTYLGIANFYGWTRAESAPIAGTEAEATIDGDALTEAPQLLGAALGRQISGKKVASARMSEANQSLYLAFRNDGQLVADGWQEGGTVREALTLLAGRLATEKTAVGKANTAEVCITHSYRQIDGNRTSTFGNIFRGVRGLELEVARGSHRIAPTMMIARNVKFTKALEFLAKRDNLKPADVSDEVLRTFECDQILVDLDNSTAVSMYRGNQIVPIASVNRNTTIAFRDGMIRWLTNHVHADGRMTYKWWPSQGKESDANNMIRQWMATAALAKIGRDLKDEGVFALAEKNIDYNLSKFYRVDVAGNGYILFNGKAKLGAMALAAFSIYLHPKREKWAVYENAILRTINSLLQKSGRYTTFYVPKGRNDNENFYPGETQLYLATRYVDEKDPAMLERIMRAFRFYRQWHRDNRNPAFIPWHTQAYYSLWEVTKEKELVDFVFEMNDWLVDTMQQWDGTKTPDAKGRFYNPRQRYGPPHASSTGVYLEGLIDAYKMARALGDDKRRKKYARAMARGLRSSMQLQFVDDVDMFYIKKKDRSRGGMRTTIYDNSIRVDNVQHTLMGVLKIVHEISDEDWIYGVGE